MMRARRTGSSEAGEGRRRGSALVIALGAIALIAVLAAVYVTVGQSDVRVAESVERVEERQAVEQEYARWILRVLSDDRLDVYLEPVVTLSGANPVFSQRLVREAFDFPATDATVASSATPAMLAIAPTDPDRAARASRLRFSPSGRHTEPSASVGNQIQANDLPVDLRMPYDPWLAASEPWFSGLDVYERVFSRTDEDDAAGAIRLVPEFFFMDNQDWWQITNIAPDGKFVNLFNLRGNFDAEPGFGLDASGDPRMSNDLTLLRVVDPTDGTVNGNPLSVRQATREIPWDLFEADGTARPTQDAAMPQRISLDTPYNELYGEGLDGSSGENEFDATFTLERFPVFTTMRQRFMFFPLGGGFPILDRAGNVATPASADYPDYSYADTDGDGMADARWFELADSFFADDPRFIGVAPGELRWVAAVRIVDLSARVNVNTATDNTVPPTTIAPAGMTPAEIDLRRVLTMEDPASAYVARSWTTPQGNFVQQGERNRLSLRYIEPPVNVDETAPRAGGESRDQYFNYDLQLDFRGSNVAGAVYPSYLAGGGTGGSGDIGRGLLQGRFSYDALRRAIENPLPIADPAVDGRDFRLRDQVGQWHGALDQSPNPTPAAGQYSPEFWLTDRSPFLREDPSAFYSGYPLYQRGLIDDVTTGSTPQTPELNLYQAFGESPGYARRRYFEEVGLIDPAENGTRSVASSSARVSLTEGNPSIVDENTRLTFGASLFDIDDLAELLTYGMANDERVTTRLEQVLAGRFFTARNGDLLTAAGQAVTRGPLVASGLSFSPLRSNRPGGLEREGHDNSVGYGRIGDASPTTGYRKNGPDGVVDAETMALLALDVRHRLTTVSGASPIARTVRSGPLDEADERTRARIETRRLVREDLDALDAALGFDRPEHRFADFDSEARIGIAGWDLDAARDFDDQNVPGSTPDIENQYPGSLAGGLDSVLEFDSDTTDNGVLGSLPALFRLYADALLPDSGMAEGAAWQIDAGSVLEEQMATLFYGHSGPELALRLAAHAAVNLHDAWDTRPFDQPTVATLLVDGRVSGEASSTGLGNPVRQTVVRAAAAGALNANNPYFAPWNDGLGGRGTTANPGIDERVNGFTGLPPGFTGNAAPLPFEADARDRLERLVEDDRMRWDAAESRRTRLDLDEIVGALPFEENGNLAPADTDGARRRLARPTNNDPTDIVPGRAVVNIIGIEPQPFITEVATLMVYTDAPRQFSASGMQSPRVINDIVNPSWVLEIEDGELAPPFNASVDPAAYSVLPATIDGRFGSYLPSEFDPDLYNPDCMLQVLAFQLHNPFDQDLVLPAGPDFYEYGIEYNGRFYPLINRSGPDALNGSIPAPGVDNVDNGTGQGAADGIPDAWVVIPAEGSKVFYVTAQPDLTDSADGLATHWADVNLSAGSGATILNTSVVEFIERQLSVYPSAGGTEARPCRLLPLSPDTMIPPSDYTVGNATPVNLVEPPANPVDVVRTPGPPAANVSAGTYSAASTDLREARLWRRYTAKVIDPVNATTAIVEPESTLSGPFWLGNDILADRMLVNHAQLARVILSTDADAAGFRVSPAGTIDSWLAASGSGASGPLVRSLISERFAVHGLASPPASGAPDVGDRGTTVLRWMSVRRPDHGVPASYIHPLTAVTRTPALPQGWEQRTLASALEANTAAQTWAFPPRHLSGSFPSWCVEASRTDPVAGTIVSGNLATSGLFFSDVPGAYAAINLYAHDTFAVFATELVNTGGTIVPADQPAVRTLATEPFAKAFAPFDAVNNNAALAIPGGVNAGNPYDTTAALVTSDGRFFAETGLAAQLIVRNDRFERFGNVRNGDPGDPLRHEDPVSVFRLTDLLGQLAIGPVHMPWRDPLVVPGAAASDTAGANNVAPGEYVTLAEMMAIASGFNQPPTATLTAPAYAQFIGTGGDERRNPLPALADRLDPLYSVYNELHVPTYDTTGSVFRDGYSRLDRGHLRIDDYVSFFNFDEDSADFGAGGGQMGFQPGQLAVRTFFEPEIGDLRIGTGAPMAMSLVSASRGMGVGRLDAGDDRLNRPVRGLVNINTAAPMTMRALPNISPQLFHGVGDLTLVNAGDELHDFWATRIGSLVNDPLTGIDLTALPPTAMFANAAVPTTVDDTAYNLFGLANPLHWTDERAREQLWARNPDVAAMIAAYRDRSHAEFRTASRPGGEPSTRWFVGDERAASIGDYGVFRIDEPDFQVALLARNYGPLIENNNGALAANDPAVLADRGRSLLNGQDAIRQQPGFETIGELAAVTVARGVDPIDPDGRGVVEFGRLPGFINRNDLNIINDPLAIDDLERWQGEEGAFIGDEADLQLAPHTIDAAGHAFTPVVAGNFFMVPDRSRPVGLGSVPAYNTASLLRNPALETAADRARNIESVTYEPSPVRRADPVTPGNPDRLVADGLANEYDEQLAHIASLANSVDVRSDLYAAWFVIRGYRRGDVEGLAPEDAMTPSVERRFLMVIDRSNVVSEADEPRVLLFRELGE